MGQTRGILSGSGPAPVGYVGPCACDPDLGSHFHRYEPTPVTPRAGEYLAGARIDPARGAVPVLSCGCSDHMPGAAFYTSAVYGGRCVALSGPYGTHADALARLPQDKEHAHETDSRAPWYAFGTFGTVAGSRFRPVLGRAYDKA